MNKIPTISNSDLTNPLSIVHNFDVSIVMPFYKKVDEFKKVLPLNAPFFQRNGIEVVISMDDDTQEKELLDLIMQYPFINWSIIINRQKHNWRNPSKAINVGIKNASKKYIMVCSPESEFYTDAIYLMRYALEYYDMHFTIGTVAFVNKEDTLIPDFLFYSPYGSIMVEKEHLIAIEGYDESLDKWGYDDDNIRTRLELHGVKKHFMPEVKLIHRDSDPDGRRKRAEKGKETPSYSIASRMLIPSTTRVNNGNWGNDYSEIIYNWSHNKESYEFVNIYLSKFIKYKLITKDQFIKNHSRILLTQSYNEEGIINKFIDDMSVHFDGIILLDDGSEDSTYEIATHPKLLLKVKKQRLEFNDLENRNICLDIASFISSEWFCFMDTDESFDKRYADLEKLTKTDADVISFSFVNLWDSEQKYNGDYPFTINGISDRFRMFRNIGHTQIYTDKKKMHFVAVPYLRNFTRSEILFLHHGMLKKEERKAKHRMYNREDINRDQQNYEHLLNENPTLFNVQDIIFEDGIFTNKTV
jgi:hypothetical protein